MPGLPSAGLDTRAWELSHRELVDTLRALIRIPSVNPPAEADGERQAADWIASALSDAGLRPEVVEPFPGRGSVIARLRGDGTGGEPLLLLSHLDVVPAPAGGWTHDPFGGDVADGYVWGRGAVDMKNLVAMEIQVLRLLARAARDAGRDPATDPIPGLTRDVLFASTADEEAGGHEGIGWLIEHRPETIRSAAAINEAGGVAMAFGGRRFYPVMVAEKGFAVYRITVHGTWGHGSMPRADNAAVRAAEVVTRLAAPQDARLTPTMAMFFDRAAASLPAPGAALARAIAGEDAAASEQAIARLCSPIYGRAARALLRDTISPDVIHAGVKYNVIPGLATVEVDCRVLPGTDEPDMRAIVLERLGPDLRDACDVDLVIYGAPVSAPVENELYALLERTIVDHDPDGIPLPVMAPFATDAKHTAKLGIPTYGFSPLRLAEDEAFLERFHGVDERVGLDALRWGLPVLYDAVRRFCGTG